MLEKVYVEEGKREEQAIESITASMGWKSRLAENLAQLDELKQEEILMLRFFDPNRHFIGKLGREAQ